jgi:hypothetical protein
VIAFYIVLHSFTYFTGPGRADREDHDEPDFARPLSTKVPHAKRLPSSAGEFVQCRSSVHLDPPYCFAKHM